MLDINILDLLSSQIANTLYILLKAIILVIIYN